MTSNTVSEEGIAKINATSKLVLRSRGDAAVEFYNDALVCFSHADNRRSNATNRIYHLWVRSNRDLFDGKATFFEGAGHNAEGKGLHFMVMHLLKCQGLIVIAHHFSAPALVQKYQSQVYERY